MGQEIPRSEWLTADLNLPHTVARRAGLVDTADPGRAAVALLPGRGCEGATGRTPGSRLEQLRGNRQGQHSIRVNDQWRVCFTWTPAGPEHVEITDYH
ncbi:type II toxin-antitoxin system RelE/ParE family toxin [Homoserinimonas sp. A520]